MPIYCHGCKTELDPSATSCNICLRPRTRADIFRGLRGAQAEKELPGKRRKIVFMAVLLAGIAGAAVYFGGPQIKILLRPHIAAFMPAPTAPVATRETPDEPEEKPTAEEPAAPKRPPQGTPYEGEDSVATALKVALRKSSPYTTEIPEKYASEEYSTEKSPPEGYAWTIFGKAYDLFSLKPLAGAVITFRSKYSEEDFTVKTDRDGNYTATMPPQESHGYNVTISHRRYRSEFLDEMRPPYHTLNLGRREDAAMLMNTTAVLHVAIFLTEDEPEFRYNFVMLPLR